MKEYTNPDEQALVPTNSNLPVESELKSCVAENGLLTEEEIQEVLALIPIHQYKKGTILVREGSYSAISYSVLRGCVRQYYLKDGEERTTFFYTEGQSIYSPKRQVNRIPSKHYLQCVEDSQLTVLTAENQLALFRRFPFFERLSRLALEEELANYQEMLATYITTTPEERYFNLVEFRPDLLDRVPQYQLASYIGVKPESLSRIRKRIVINQRKKRIS